MSAPEQDTVDEQIRSLLRAQRMRGDFGQVHTAPATPAEVPDHAGARLVVLGPEHPHRADDPDSPALPAAMALLTQAGEDGSPRVYANMLVFLAADAERLDELRGTLAAGQSTGGDVRELLGETWQWLLVPSRAAGAAGAATATAVASWATGRAPGREDLAMRASRQLKADGDLFVDYPPERLRADLDRVPLWPAAQRHVALADVWEAYARSLELPRLRSSATLAAAVVGGVSRDDWAEATFAYADAYDAARGRFDGLVAGPQPGGLALRGSGLIVHPDAARAQLGERPPES